MPETTFPTVPEPSATLDEALSASPAETVPEDEAFVEEEDFEEELIIEDFTIDGICGVY